ncbi:hypothetical protein E4T56_gene18311 [Termitomyces sp. T112]|nr:hypothetical protein E4T56_gene18311 [Termitomyces sp. T112]
MSSKNVEPAVDTGSQADVLYDWDEVYSRAYGLKCNLINKCMQEEIGYGRYQWQLFVLTGFGWMADNIWLQGIAIVLGQVQQELRPSRVEFATLAGYAGLILGATTWGIMADLVGRKLSFNITLFLAAVFGIAAGGAPNFLTFAALGACLGFGLGGNLPVDGALYLEHIPQQYQWTLTLLSVWWAIGQFVASLIAWGFIGNFSCEATATVCLKGDNMGWRYTYYTFGCMTFLMFFMRFIVFDLQESPKYLVAKGRDQEAIAVLQHVAKRNGKMISLTLEQFSAIEGTVEDMSQSPFEVVRRAFSTISLSHVRPLFSGHRLAINSTLIIICWGLIGLAYPLFNGFLPLYLEQHVTSSTGSDSINITYRNYAIISIMGIPGSILACLIVDWTRSSKSRWSLGGRKLTMAVSTGLTGLFLFLFTTSKTDRAVLGWSCASGVTQNAMYGVLYAYTPEVFPAPHRGTGDALASSFNRVMGILSPVIKIATTTATGAAAPGSSPNASIFIAATLFMVAAILMVFLPIETAGRAAM